MKIVTIGRSSTNDVNINDPQVSRAHCQIILDDNGTFRLIDTNSSNGTFVNGVKRHGEIILSTSDIIRIGNTTLPWQTYFKTNLDGYNTSSVNGPSKLDEPVLPPTQKPGNFLVWAILGTLFCCLPFGIVSIVYASKVDGLWYAGYYDEAEEAASKARTWFWWSFGLGLASILLNVIYYVVAGASLLHFR